MKDQTKEKLWFVFFFIATTIIPMAISWSFVSLPLTDDVRVFVGAANQADLNGQSFPHNVDTAWELKPVGNRVLWYIVVKISTVLVGINQNIQIMSLLAALLVSALLAGEISRCVKGHPDLLFIIALIALVSPYNLFLMQAEWWALIFSYIALWLLLRETPSSMFFAGVLSLFVASLKLSTVFLIPTIFVAYILIAGYEKGIFRRILPYLIGLGLGIVEVVCWILWLPNTIPDIFFSMNVAHASRGVSFSLADAIVYFLHYAYAQVISLPVLVFGVVAGLSVFCVCLSLLINARGGNKEEKIEVVIHILLFISLWLFPSLAIFVQGEFFAYHYMVLALPAVISVFLLGNIIENGETRKMIYHLVVFGIVVFWLLHCSVWSPNYSAQQAYWDNIDKDYKSLEEKYHISQSPTLLYLTNADAPYWWKVSSACRQIGSLPLLYNMTGTKEYAETEQCIREYRGEFVVTTHEIGNTIPPVSGTDISNAMPGKYLPNYTRIEETTNWDIYRRIT